MSGLEVIGIVLGGIPLIISALEHYQDGSQAIRVWRKYKTEIASVIRQLRVQQSRLTNVCEILLEDLGLGWKIEVMIREPFGSSWQDDNIKKKLAQRLHRDYDIFEEIVREMSVATENIKKKIGLGPDGKTEWAELSTWRRELKRASFTFDRSEYGSHLQILKEGNEHLEILTRHNKDLEPKRERRLHSHHLSLLRTVSDNVFRALQSSLSCSCSHGLGLELSPARTYRELRMQRQDGAFDFVFRIGISESNSPGNFRKEKLLAPLLSDQQVGIPTLLPSTIGFGTNYWTPSAIANLSTKQTAKSPRKQRLTLNSALSLGAVRSMAASTASTENTASVPASQEPTQIVDLCSAVLGAIDEPSPSSYGVISTRETKAYSKFEVHVPSISDSHGHDLITLDQILRDKDASLYQIKYIHKVRLVYFVSYAFLQLSEKSWLTASLSSRDIIFIRENGSLINFRRVFVGRDIFDQNPPPVPSKTAVGKQPRNHTLLSLAILLIEIMLQGPFERLQESKLPWNKAAVRDARSDLEAAQGLATRVNNEFGSTFGSAIRRCITGNFDCESTSLDDEDFRQEFYAGVVALLEENMEYAGVAQ